MQVIVLYKIIMFFSYCKIFKNCDGCLKHCLSICLSMMALVYALQARSGFITQIDITQAGEINSVYIKLLEKDAPLTVQNFRNYVSDGDYANLFIHRSISGFIVQGGGFTFDSSLNNGLFVYDAASDAYPGGLQEVPKDVAVVNEFGRSNLRGTVAMAKIGALFEDATGNPCFPEGPNCTLVPDTGPDTATSEWFFNLADNSANLDVQNGGFTVFAEVLGSGMDIIDGIANEVVFDRADIHFAFSSIPLVNFSSGPIIDSDLISIKTVIELLSISPDINYGIVTSGSNLQPEIVIKNVGVNTILIGEVDIQGSLSTPFRIVSDQCSNKQLLPDQRCSFIALFTPETIGVFEDSFEIDFPNLGIRYSITLTGEGGSEAAEPDITSTLSSIDFGVKDVIFNQNILPYKQSIVINNFGSVQLDLIRIKLSSSGNPAFSLGGDCLGVSGLEQNEFCILDILYFPQIAGSNVSAIIIETNDPDESPFEIPIFAVALPENDGVDIDVENAAPNNGDGNNDDVLDSQQSHIASLPDINGTYITYVSDVSKPFVGMQIVDASIFNENQEGVNLSAGVHEFTVNNVGSGEIIEIGVLLPEGVEPSAYYIFGPTSDDPTSHWYKFDFNGETGASFFGDAKLTSPSGDKIEKNFVILLIKNGGRGDGSTVLDSELVIRSGISYSDSGSGGSGLLSNYFLYIMVLMILLTRVFRKTTYEQHPIDT
ncbi:MAG: hypothetical protein COA54_01125 [Thiotrichaceae bacterium]|nr:MAG: hypothetical protein COA54_01125 [Thiotrichaceae bacterium]